MEPKEIDHVAQAEAVDQIPQRAAEDQRESGRSQPTTLAGLQPEGYHPAGDRQGEQSKWQAPVGKKRKRDAGIVDPEQREDRQNVDALPVGQGRGGRGLCRLIDGHDRADGEQAERREWAFGSAASPASHEAPAARAQFRTASRPSLPQD
jgi:hypothetical protein